MAVIKNKVKALCLVTFKSASERVLKKLVYYGNVQILKCRSYFATALTIYFLDEPFMPMIWLGVLVFDSCW